MIELANYIAEKGVRKVAEVGVGNLSLVWRRLEELGIEVVKTDVKNLSEDVIVDDVCEPDIEIYRGVELVYSIRPPYEIQRCIVELGKRLGVDVIIVPLKNEIIEGGKLVNYKSAKFYIFTPLSP